MIEPVLSAGLLNDAEDLVAWARRKGNFPVKKLFRICRLCGRPFGYHCKDNDRCPSLHYDFKSGIVKAEDFEADQKFYSDEEMTPIFIAYLALIGVRFET
jgi:hypothetical protein